MKRSLAAIITVSFVFLTLLTDETSAAPNSVLPGKQIGYVKRKSKKVYYRSKRGTKYVARKTVKGAKVATHKTKRGTKKAYSKTKRTTKRTYSKTKNSVTN